jgi:SAM-dependent methyltransferase
MRFTSECPICGKSAEFSALDDFWHGRDGLASVDCPLNSCVTRERALAYVLNGLYGGNLTSLRIHESSPAARGLSVWLKKNCSNYTQTGYFPEQAAGTMIEHIRNENLERQTFPDSSFDLVIHTDVMEHLFNPFAALREIYRTLAQDGICCFTAPTYWDRLQSTQVAFKSDDGSIQTEGDPEYHGNPQSKSGSLVTWRYGYDLPLLISRDTRFDVEVRRFQSKKAAAIGVMTEVYILTK